MLRLRPSSSLHQQDRIKFIALILGVIVLVGLSPTTAQADQSHSTTLASAAATAPKPMLGGFSRDPSWYSGHIGAAEIYRTYDPRFHGATWQQTSAYRMHGNAPEDYSINIAPGRLASGAYDARLTAFLATTPKNLIITNLHEPEQRIANGAFTAAQFRASIIRLATLVHAQNARDGGSRRVSIILMAGTITGFKGRHPMDYWPGRDANGKNYVDLLSIDTYSAPHATNTAGVPVGYTDGQKWQSAADLLDPSIAFANRIGSPWLISELGFLEDVHDPMRRAHALVEFVNYARQHGAVAVEYWDSVGRRANWQLRNGNGAAARAWKSLVAGP
jgi:hypothetical protein